MGMHDDWIKGVMVDSPTGRRPLRAKDLHAGGALGYRAVLYGDSMTELNNTLYSASAAAYAASTGVLTITQSGHGRPKGSPLSVFNRSYEQLSAARYLTVASWVNANSYTIQLPANLSGVPDGALSGTTYVRGDLSRSSQSWARWLSALLGQRFNIIHNGAQSGDKVQNCLARLDSDCLAYSPDLVIMQSPGVNDLTFDAITFSNNQGEIYANLKTMLDRILDCGASLLLSNLTPVYTGEARAQLRIMQGVQAINEWLRQYAQNHRGVYLVDAYKAILNPTDATGLARQYYLNATDNIHYVGTGAYAVAASCYQDVDKAFPASPSSLPTSTTQSRTNSALTSPTAVASNGVVTFTSASAYVEKGMEFFVRGATGSYTAVNGRHVAVSGTASNTFTAAIDVPDGSVTGTLVISTSRQLVADPLLQTTSGGTLTGTGFSGTVANQLRVLDGASAGTMTVVASVVAARSGFGNAQRVVISGASLNDRAQFTFKASVGTVDSQMSPGRAYVLEAEVFLSSTAWVNTPLSEIFFQLSLTGNGGGETWVTWDMNQYGTGAGVPFSGDTTLHLRTAPITIPADASAINSGQFNFYARHQAAISGGASLTMEVSRVAVHDVTDDYAVYP